MLGQNPSQPALFQMVDVESLVPANHRLRRIDAALDLGFVREAVAACYKPGRGRPSVDPELVVRMMILGALYDLSDRQLCDEIAMHAGFRWFCRLNFHDSVLDHSTLSRLRNERWAKSEVFTRLFNEVLGRCVQAGMVSGRHVLADGTQMRADASMKSLVRSERNGGDDADNLPPAAEAAVPSEPQAEGAWQGHGERYSNKTHYSRTDPDARPYRKGHHQSASLCYLVHDLIDTKSRVILGRRASIATSFAEREVALDLVREHEARRESLGLAQAIEILTADAGYGVSTFVADLIDQGITPHVPLQAAPELEPEPLWQRRTFDLSRHRKRREAARLVRARNRTRLATRSSGYAVSRKLRIRSEHTFAEGKTQHGLGRARYRSLPRVDRQSLLVATVQNLKRLAETLHRAASAAASEFRLFAQHASCRAKLPRDAGTTSLLHAHL